MKHFHFYILVAIFATIAISCNKDDEADNAYKEVELTTKSAEFAAAGSSFSFELIDRINSSVGRNYIISPLSMQFLLGMVLDAAEGDTADEICNVLGYGSDGKEAVDEYSLSMLEQLPNLDKKTVLTIGNALFADKAYPLLETYSANVGKYYRAEVSNLDFSDVKSSLSTINNWCSNNTNGMIPKALNALSPDEPVILMDVMYFKGKWKEKFDKKLTDNEKFTTEEGSEITLKMMKQGKSFPYTENDIFRAVSLPYGNSAFSMVILLPKDGCKVADVTALMKETDWDAFIAGMSSCNVELQLPKFQTETSIKFNDILSSMGMPLAFDAEKANFSALSNSPIYLNLVQQDAIIKVDEDGSEAAVASTARFGKSANVVEAVEFHADHPFLYLIVEKSTSVILFAGRFDGN